MKTGHADRQRQGTSGYPTDSRDFRREALSLFVFRGINDVMNDHHHEEGRNDRTVRRVLTGRDAGGSRLQ
jgi:hypothetical protein